MFTSLLGGRVVPSVEVGDDIQVTTNRQLEEHPLCQVRAAVIVSTLVRAPPGGDKMRSSCRTLHRKGKDEHHHLGSPVESCSDSQLRYILTSGWNLPAPRM